MNHFGEHKPVHKLLNNDMILNVQLYKIVWAVPRGPCGMGGSNIGLSPSELRTCHPIPMHEFHATCNIK